MQVFFGENVFKNERIGSHRGWRAPGTPPLDPPMVRSKRDENLFCLLIELNCPIVGLNIH